MIIFKSNESTMSGLGSNQSTYHDARHIISPSVLNLDVAIEKRMTIYVEGCSGTHTSGPRDWSIRGATDLRHGEFLLLPEL